MLCITLGVTQGSQCHPISHTHDILGRDQLCSLGDKKHNFMVKGLSAAESAEGSSGNWSGTIRHGGPPKGSWQYYVTSLITLRGLGLRLAFLLVHVVLWSLRMWSL